MKNDEMKDIISFKTNEAIRQKAETQKITDNSKTKMIPFLYKHKIAFENLQSSNSIKRINLIYKLKRKTTKK